MFTWQKRIASWLRDETGTIMVAFAVMLPVVVGSVGMSMDLAQAYLVRQRLGGAVDASALAATASESDQDAIEQKVHDFLDKNYPPEKIGNLDLDYDVDVQFSGDDVIVTATAVYDTTFMKVLGIDHVNVTRSTTVHREVRGLEVVLVLDNTGSMSTNNNIGSLKSATTSFINILFSHTSNPNNIKIGLVPYANAVRLGKYGLGLNPDGTPYGDGTPMVTLPTGVTYTTTHDPSNANKWYGCVIEHNESGWNAASTANDPYPDDVLDDYEGPWDPYLYETYTANKTACGQTCNPKTGKCTTNSCYVRSSSPNTNCPYAMVQPLTSNQATLLADVATMKAHGNTLGDIGMAWGYRVLSPEAPFEEAEDWDNPRWRKAIIIMTDGDNTRDNEYSAFWRARNNQLDVPDYNDRFAETCEALKEKGVLVYTVTFFSNINEDTKDFYRNCATSESQYYDAPSQADLINVFEKISRELANLHISS